MFRHAVILACVLASAPAAAQRLTELKYIGRGVGCTGPLTTPLPRLSVCAGQDGRSRVWCPNGTIFEREGTPVPEAILRSLCQMSQTP
jgi:hypothetical protein